MTMASATGPRGRASTPQRGIALVLVLWVLALLSLIVAGFLTMTKSETDMVRARIVQAEAMALSDGAVHWTIERLTLRVFSDDPVWSSIPVDGSPVRIDLPGGRAVVRIYDVAGLLDINAANPDLLRGLMMALGVPPQDAETLADRIVDYRDTDDTPLPFGAEAADYLAAGLSLGPRNGPFMNTDELRQVIGMPIDLARTLDPYITVDSGARGIDPDAAPPLLLAAVPGLSRADVETILTMRGRDEEFSGIQRTRNPNLVPSSSSTFRIIADARTDSGGRFLRDAVIQLRGAGALFMVRHWRQARADQSPP